MPEKASKYIFLEESVKGISLDPSEAITTGRYGLLDPTSVERYSGTTWNWTEPLAIKLLLNSGSVPSILEVEALSAK